MHEVISIVPNQVRQRSHVVILLIKVSGMFDQFYGTKPSAAESLLEAGIR